MKSYSFYYSQLTEQQKETYMIIYKSWKNKEKKVSFEVPDGWDKAKIPWRILFDHPMLFYVVPKATSMRGKTMTLYSEFLYIDSEIDYYTSKISEYVYLLYDKFVKNKTSEYDKELAIHDCLCRNLQYDYSEVQEDHDKENYNKENHNVIGALFSQRGVCEGFSKLFKLMCDAAHIESVVVVGKAYTNEDRNEDGGHAWNMVFIDDKPYHVDVTLDSGADVQHDYFNLDDKNMLLDHCVDKMFPVVECKHMEDNYFIKNNLCVNSPREFSELVKKKIADGEKIFGVKMNFNTTGDIRKLLNSCNFAFMFVKSIKYTFNKSQKVINFEIS